MNDVGDLLADRYRLRHHLGSGGMGVVWYAIDERLQRPVAVKQLFPQPGLTQGRVDETRERAMREGRIAARLHHPNAIAVHDVTEHDGMPVLVMEYLSSRSLAQVLTEHGSMPPPAAADIGSQAASALAAAHAAGIVHRDIKPANILIGENGAVKITDFGISHAAGDAVVTQTGVMAGTPAYLAPEIARGDQPTPHSDVFSLGATLYAAVEGNPPFGDNDENSLALLHAVAAGNAPPPRHAGPLTDVLMWMLHNDPGQRPTPARAGEAMHAIAAGQPPPKAVPSGPWQTQRPAPDARASSARNNPQATRLDAHPLSDDLNGTQSSPADFPPPAAPRRRRRSVVLVAAAALVALLAGALALSQLGGDQNTAQTPSSAGPRPIAPADLERAVSDYYALLPEHPGNAWPRLGPALQAQGQAEYQRFWATVAGITIISPPRSSGPSTVHIGIELAMRDGSRIQEFHQLGLVPGNGIPLINSDALLQSQHIPAPPPPPPPEDHRKGDKDRKGGDDKKGRGN